MNIFPKIIKSILNNILFYLIIHIIIIKCEEECPIDLPIYINSKNRCSLEYCTDEQYKNEECIVSNKIIKQQWLNTISIIGESNKSLYPSVWLGIKNDIFFETNIDKNEKVFFTIEEDGRGFMDGPEFDSVKYSNNNYLFNIYGNSFLLTINNHKCFFKLSFYESIEVYDLLEKKYTNNKLKNILGYNIKSYYNSLLRTNEDNIFIYAYITTGNYLAMQKIKFISNDASNCLEIIKTLIEEEKTIPKNSRRCLITELEFIECLDMDEEQNYYVRIYDSDLNFINKYELEKNNAPPERAFSLYHYAAFLKKEISMFIYFIDISNNNAKPIIQVKQLENKSLDNLYFEITRHVLFTDLNLGYYFSDTENSFTILNDYYYVFVSLTTYENRHLIISLINLFNRDRTIRIRYFDIPLKDLYNIDYHSNLNAFHYQEFLGIQFIQIKNNSNYLNTMLLFNYVNTSDPEPIYNIFEKYNKNSILYTIKLSDYINLQNNIFCYALTGMQIISIPNPSTGIIILKSNSSQLIQGEVIALDEIITISYSNEGITKGNYFLSFSPAFKEPEYNDLLACIRGTDNLGKSVEINWESDSFIGRVTKFKFTVGNCYQNCETCIEEGDSFNNQKCESCIEGFYFEENTKNCYKTANEGSYFNINKNAFSKCYKNCKTCNDINQDENNHKCLTCKENYLLYKNSNCLNCKYLNMYTNYDQTSCIGFIPNGYYLFDNKYNIIEKCHQNCLTCNKGSNDDNNMNCLLCDNENGYYFLENTANCYKLPYIGYFLDDDYKIKKCYYACKTCSSGPIYNINGEIENMNCDTCNNELGFFKIDSSSKNCEFKEKIGEYYDISNNNYYPCYSNCLTCFNREYNNLIMNCLSCNETKGFFLYTKNGNNCLNCKSENKYINYDENECLDDIPKGYYISNNITNKLDLCYSKCETCSEKGLSDKDMKCDSCLNNYILDNKNCVLEKSCPKYFYFMSNIDKNIANFREKICVNNEYQCPSFLPFYFSHTNECVDICPIELIISQGCKISNLENGLNQFLTLIKIDYSKGNIENLNKIFKFSQNSQNFLVKINIYDYIDDNINNNILVEEKKEIQNIDNDDNSIFGKNIIIGKDKINLDRCLEMLNNNSIINNETKLKIIRLDIQSVNFNASNFYFELFDDNNRLENINLSICYQNNLISNSDLNSIIIPNISKFINNYTNNDNDKTNTINDTNIENNTNINNGSNIISNTFYNDECYVYSENGADVLVEDRKISNFANSNNTFFSNISSDFNTTYKYNNYTSDNISLNSCPFNCILDKIDYTSNRIYCYCPIENNNKNKNGSDLEFQMQDIIYKSGLNPKRITKSVSYSNSNIYVLKCIGNIPKYF